MDHVTVPGEQNFWNAEAQTMPVQRRRELQLTRLQQAVDTAAKAPFFGKRLAQAGVGPGDIRSLDDVRTLPVISKEDLRQSEAAAPPLGDYRVRGIAEAVRIGMSSGTTGKPTTMMWTKHDLEVECELSARNHFRLGIRPGMVVVGAHPGYLNGGQALQQAAYEFMGCLLISIGPPESVEAAERALRAIEGLPIDRWQLFPAALQRLREAAERIGFEGLPSAHAGHAESQYDKFSAGQECVAYLGSTCRQSAGSHVAEDYAVVEVLDVESGDPVPDGRRGRLVVTSLGRDNPMIRYNVEDIVRVESAWCPCGETTPRGFYEGRAKDIVSVAGRAILPIDVARALPPGAEFVIVRAPGPADKLHVQVEGHIDDAVDRITESTGVPVEVEWRSHGSLPRAAYKAQRVVDSVV